MDFGMPTLLELETLEENVILAKELGLKFVEINMNFPQYQPIEMDVKELKKLKDKYNIYFTLHIQEDFDFAKTNAVIRKAHLLVYEQAVGIAKALNMPIINLHLQPGIYFTLPNKKVYLYKKHHKQYLENVEFFKNLSLDLLNDTDIELCIENTGIFDMDFICHGVESLIDNPKIWLTWDVGHDYSSGFKDEELIMKNLNKLGHIHLHDAVGKNNHLPLYTGDMDIDHKLVIAKEHDCRIVVETKTIEALRASVGMLRNKGY